MNSTTLKDQTTRLNLKGLCSQTLAAYSQVAGYLGFANDSAQLLKSRSNLVDAAECYKIAEGEIVKFERETIRQGKPHYAPLIEILRERLAEFQNS